MRPFPEYDSYDALGLAELVRKREVGADELCEEAIRHIERINPEINAVILQRFDSARKAARGKLKEGPFSGVPFLTRDLLTSYSGIPQTAGAGKGCEPDDNCELMRRYMATGVIVLGETNTPESCLAACTGPLSNGRTRNPWSRDHEPGGTSGGSAAAVASGMVPMASGSDACGSLRIPASCCGLFGLKPTRGRTPTGPNHGELWQGALAEHVVTRTVRDSAAMLDAVQGADIGAPYVIPGPEHSYLEELKKEPGTLRIAFTTRSPLGTEVHPECRAAVENAAHLLMSLGHTVEEAEPDIDGSAMAKSFFMLSFGETSADISELKSVLGRKPVAADLEDAAWVFKLLGDSFSAGDFVLSMRRWNTFARRMGLFLKKYDLYLTPTLATPPARIGEARHKPLESLLIKIVGQFSKASFTTMSAIIDEFAVESLAGNPFTPIANIAGLPAMSVPLHWTATGLPCGVQLIGPFGGEAALFKLAAQLENARPWFARRPYVAMREKRLPGNTRMRVQSWGN